MHSVSFDVLVLVLLCIIIAGVVYSTRFEEDSTICPVGFNWEGVCSSYPQILLSSIRMWMDVLQREESLSLVFAEGIALLADGCPYSFTVRFIAMYSNDGLF